MIPKPCERCGRMDIDPIWHEFCKEKTEETAKESVETFDSPEEPKTYESYLTESTGHYKHLMDKYGANPGAKVPEPILKPSENHFISPSIRN